MNSIRRVSLGFFTGSRLVMGYGLAVFATFTFLYQLPPEWIAAFYEFCFTTLRFMDEFYIDLNWAFGQYVK